MMTISKSIAAVAAGSLILLGAAAVAQNGGGQAPADGPGQGVQALVLPDLAHLDWIEKSAVAALREGVVEKMELQIGMPVKAGGTIGFLHRRFADLTVEKAKRQAESVGPLEKAQAAGGGRRLGRRPRPAAQRCASRAWSRPRTSPSRGRAQGRHRLDQGGRGEPQDRPCRARPGQADPRRAHDQGPVRRDHHQADEEPGRERPGQRGGRRARQPQPPGRRRLRPDRVRLPRQGGAGRRDPAAHPVPHAAARSRRSGSAARSPSWTPRSSRIGETARAHPRRVREPRLGAPARPRRPDDHLPARRRPPRPTPRGDAGTRTARTPLSGRPAVTSPIAVPAPSRHREIGRQRTNRPSEIRSIRTHARGSLTDELRSQPRPDPAARPGRRTPAGPAPPRPGRPAPVLRGDDALRHQGPAGARSTSGSRSRSTSCSSSSTASRRSRTSRRRSSGSTGRRRSRSRT